MKIILQPEISIDTDQLVKQLREQAMSACCGGSDAADRLEYKAAAVIEELARGERRQSNHKMLCRDCVHRLKPMGGTDNDPDSLCRKTLKTNHVTGNIDMVKCEIANKTGSCFYFSTKGEGRDETI